MNIRGQTRKRKLKEKLDFCQGISKLNKDKKFCKEERSICVMSETCGDFFVK